MNYTLQKMLKVAESAAVSAGRILLKAFHERNSDKYRDGLPVADVEAEDLICNVLDKHFPASGLRVEERVERNRRSSSDMEGVWLIDPHDGTSAAHDGHRGACVSIGLIRDGLPVLGVVYAYAYPDESGDLISWAEGCGPVRRNGSVVEPRVVSSRPTIMVSKHADRRYRAYLEVLAPMQYRAMPGIAYRLAAVSVGDADAAISLHTPRDFDCVGGHALLRGAGLDLYDIDGVPIRYDAEHPRTYEGCFGGADQLCQKLTTLDWTRVRTEASIPPPNRILTEPTATKLISGSHLLSRVQGCWLGQLSGDALGSQVEFESAKTIAAKYPRGVRRMLDGGTFNTLAGQPTDDSEMALYLGRALLKSEGYDADQVALGYRRWFESKPFDIGNTVTQALRGQNPRTPAASMVHAANPSSQANGALMRIAPVAIYSVGLSEEAAASVARKDAELTHPNAVAIEANELFVATIRHCLLRVSGSADAYSFARDYCHKHNFSEEIVTWLRDAQHGPPDDFVTQMGWLRIALQNAFYYAQRGTDLETALIETVGRGGDTDTNACIAGALLGAMHGLGAIPRHWQEEVLTCRPMSGLPYTVRPRPVDCWPVDALILSEQWALIGEIQR